MSFKLVFEERDGWLLSTVTGKIQTCGELFEKAHEVVKTALKLDVKRVLVDDRNVSMLIDAHDACMLAESMEKMNIQARGLRIACICKPLDQTIYRIFETGHQNRSLNFIAFTDEQPALDWLLES